jgi:hypothetical protein
MYSISCGQMEVELYLLLVSFQDILMLSWNVGVDGVGRGYLEVIRRW